MEVKIEDNSQQVVAELDKATEKALFAVGLLGVAGCVEKASEIDSVTGRPTVDTGRYRAGFGFVTPTTGKMSGTPAEEKKPSDDISANRAPKDTVVIANNVEYAPYLEFGSGTQQGGHHARYIMKRGIESKFAEMQRVTKQIYEGEDVGLSLNLPTGD
ncbi:MAG: HK97 gp10 family phage protein [Clostridia bacterium]|nr:HK97 gp10 family phage protein [Clostridia bacterium]